MGAAEEAAPVVEDDAAPVVEEAPVEDDVAPVVDEAPVVEDDVAPVVDEAPVEDDVAPVADDVDMEAVAVSAPGTSGSILSALFIILTVASAAGVTLYFVGNTNKRHVLTYDGGKDSELDRLFRGQFYYQSLEVKEEREHYL